MSGKKRPGPAASKVAVPQAKVKQTPTPAPAPAKKTPAVEPKATGPSPKGVKAPKKTT